MSKAVSKFTLAAGLVLAMAFIFSCGQHELYDGGGGNSFSYCLISGQCLDGPFTSKECGDLGGLPSNNCTGGGGGNPSSSSGGGQGGNPSSSSGGGGQVGGGSSSSGGGGGDNPGGDGNCTVDFGCIAIGSQVWAKRNLNYDVGSNKCYGNDPANCTKYGRLYNRSTARTACPNGWHLPSYDEWQTLVDFAGGKEVAGEKLKAKEGWEDCGPSGSGKPYLCEDSYGFSALPGGHGTPTGSFVEVGIYGDWWNATDGNKDCTFSLGNDYSGRMIGSTCNSDWFSIRCIQDNTGGGGGNPSSSSNGGQGDNPSSSSGGGQGGGGTGGPANWTAVADSPFGTSAIRSVAYGNNTWVAVGAGGSREDGKIAYSTDGRSWTEATQTIFVKGNYSEINVVTFGNGMFIAASGAKMAYSTDGRSWMAINFPFSSSTHIRGIAYNNNIWVAVGANGRIAYSLDGMNWTAIDATEAFGTEQVSSVAYGNNIWVAAGNRGKIAYSADGTSWTATANGGFYTALGYDITGIAFANGRFVVVMAWTRSNYTSMAYSTDGISWTAVTPNPGGFDAIAFGNNRYVAVGPNGRMSYSTDGITAWTTIGNTGFGATNDDDILDVAYGNGRFVAVGEQGQIAYAEW